jgi:hypothetical protein
MRESAHRLGRSQVSNTYVTTRAEFYSGSFVAQECFNKEINILQRGWQFASG